MHYRRRAAAAARKHHRQRAAGSWVTPYHNQVDARAATEMFAAAMDAGINFFDNAEAYALGKREIPDGEAFSAEMAAPELRVSTKFFWGLDREGNGDQPQATR